MEQVIGEKYNHKTISINMSQNTLLNKKTVLIQLLFGLTGYNWKTLNTSSLELIKVYIFYAHKMKKIRSGNR